MNHVEMLRRAGDALAEAQGLLICAGAGMGVDSGIHLIHRSRANALPEGNLLRSATARAVLLSAITTIASFGTLAFTTHLGMATLGRLLALGIALILVCNLVVLPALAHASGHVRAKR